MNIIYLSSTSSGMHSQSIYFDLMQELSNNGHDVTIAYAREKRQNKKTEKYRENGMTYLGIKTGNTTKNKNLIEKGLSLLTLDYLFSKGITDNLNGEKYDLILYSTPPITLIKTLKKLKKQSKDAVVYLMLKDIFPQNAVDIGMMKENSLIHKFFKRKEQSLYSIADYIGTMSPANSEYFIKHNPDYKDKVELFPNTIKFKEKPLRYTKAELGLDENKVTLVYGGNLGYPQAIENLVECAKSIEGIKNVELVVAGTGAKQGLIEEYIRDFNPKNFKYLGQLEKDKYDELVLHSQVGLIFLDHRFTIPNFPQRLLSYLEAKIPVIVAADEATDMGTIAEDNGFGYKVISNDVLAFKSAVIELIDNETSRTTMGENGYKYLLENYTVEKSVEIIERRFK